MNLNLNLNSKTELELEFEFLSEFSAAQAAQGSGCEWFRANPGQVAQTINLCLAPDSA